MSVELPQTVQESVPVETIDGDVGMSTSLARSLARKMYLSGFALLPWMWFVNVWFFWPHINGNDRVLKKCKCVVPRLTNNACSHSTLLRGSLSFSREQHTLCRACKAVLVQHKA